MVILCGDSMQFFTPGCSKSETYLILISPKMNIQGMESMFYAVFMCFPPGKPTVRVLGCQLPSLPSPEPPKGLHCFRYILCEVDLLKAIEFFLLNGPPNQWRGTWGLPPGF